MGYTLGEISDIQLKADKTIYRLGSIAYDNMLFEDSETLDYERDTTFLLKKASEWADDYYVGDATLDKIVERLSSKVNLYSYGKLTPIYSDSVESSLQSISTIYALKATTLTINGATYDLSADRVWNIPASPQARNEFTFTATANQTVFNVAYIPNQIDVYYNGAKLLNTDFTATTGTYITLGFTCSVGDNVIVIAYINNLEIGGGGIAGTMAKWSGTSTLVNAIANTDYQSPISVTSVGNGGNATFVNNVINIPRDYYIHDQQASSNSWTITHNMNKYPAVNIVDTANDEVIGEVRYNTLNQITISFTAATSGKAYLN